MGPHVNYIRATLSGRGGKLLTVSLTRCVAISVVFILLSLVPMAYANPADSSWLAGFYDGADFDELIGAVVSESGIVANAFICTAATGLTTTAVWFQPEPLGIETGFSNFSIRAPPSPARIPLA